MTEKSVITLGLLFFMAHIVATLRLVHVESSYEELLAILITIGTIICLILAKYIFEVAKESTSMQYHSKANMEFMLVLIVLFGSLINLVYYFMSNG